MPCKHCHSLLVDELMTFLHSESGHRTMYHAQQDTARETHTYKYQTPQRQGYSSDPLCCSLRAYCVREVHKADGVWQAYAFSLQNSDI